MQMPSTWCDGSATITPVDAFGEEVFVAISVGAGYRSYMRREKREHDRDFVARVKAFCEKKYRELRGY